ncbi:unnamed protein product [Protopolystoma xenopodis]|uniref:Mitoferrin-1 n=1 Tax=Protopolystoma xenopodis TaxID=117903 RepID=A0A448WL68_9PLAT|nr:unnamed protein product [Protopolystoma xenopodis]
MQQRCFLVGDTNSSPIRHSWSGFAQLRGSGHNHHHHHHHSPAQSQISSEHQASRPASFSAGTANATSNTSEVGVSGNRTAIKGLLGACRIVYQLEGPGGFTRGIVARILTSMPGAAISWSVYEYFKWWFGQTRHKSSYPTPSLPPPSGPGFITAAAAPDDIEPGDRTGHSASSGAAGSISIFFSSSASTPSTTAASTGLPVI